MSHLSKDQRADFLDWIEDAIAHLIDLEVSEADAVDLVADLLDALLVLPEPLDTMSDAAIMATLKPLAAAMRRDPDRMEARAAELRKKAKKTGGRKHRRMLQRAGRLSKRAEKVRARQDDA